MKTPISPSMFDYLILARNRSAYNLKPDQFDLNEMRAPSIAVLNCVFDYEPSWHHVTKRAYNSCAIHNGFTKTVKLLNNKNFNLGPTYSMLICISDEISMHCPALYWNKQQSKC